MKDGRAGSSSWPVTLTAVLDAGLACLIHALLDGITAAASARRGNPPVGLLDLVRTKWPEDTALSRAHL